MLELTRKHDLEGNRLPNRALTHFLLLKTVSLIKHVYQGVFCYKTCLSMSFPSKSCLTVRLEFP